MVGLTAAWVYAQIPCVANAQSLLRSSKGKTSHNQRPGAGCNTAGHRIRACGWGPSSERAPRQTRAQAVDDGPRWTREIGQDFSPIQCRGSRYRSLTFVHP
ncbi:hypothetical protein K523DRAFT_130984 [Schizophyllum commune Tattone D]|nr:hypothetical protein K523DRAFT_130984 [Schizophyllum commune Tattone D]